MWIDIISALLISLVAVGGLLLSNMAFDRRIAHYLSRKVGHFFGGIAYLLCYLVYDSGVYPLILSSLFAAVLLLANLRRPDTFRGVGGSGRPTKAISEAAFPLAAIPTILIGWIIMDQAAVVTASLLFMAWGDCVTGLVRAAIYGKAIKGWQGSAMMWLVCGFVGTILLDPAWVGLVGATVGTIVEKLCGDVGKIRWLDDNFAIPVASAAVMLPLVEIFG